MAITLSSIPAIAETDWLSADLTGIDWEGGLAFDEDPYDWSVDPSMMAGYEDRTETLFGDVLTGASLLGNRLSEIGFYFIDGRLTMVASIVNDYSQEFYDLCLSGEVDVWLDLDMPLEDLFGAVYDSNKVSYMVLADRFRSADAIHPLGTDSFGRDLLLQVIYLDSLSRAEDRQDNSDIKYSPGNVLLAAHKLPDGAYQILIGLEYAETSQGRPENGAMLMLVFPPT